MYIETSTGLIGHKAVLVSPRFQQAYSNSKLSFFYHMYGRSIGSLSVYLNDGNRTRLWTLQGLYHFCERPNLWLDLFAVVPDSALPRFVIGNWLPSAGWFS